MPTPRAARHRDLEQAIRDQAQATRAAFTAATVAAPNAQAAGYTFTAADARRLTTATGAAGQTFTIPADTFPVGAELQVCQLGAGQVTYAAAAGVTLRVPHGAKTAVQYALARAVQVAADTWVIAGDVTT